MSEIMPFTCGNCQGTQFILFFMQEPLGKITLTIQCANPQCVDKKREELKAGKTDLIVWEQFDVTGQGYDQIFQSTTEEEEKDLN